MAHRPLYAALADELRRNIAAGRWGIGETLPPEIDIASEKGLSRSTVRAALNCLVEDGLISRRKGSGTRVEASEPSRAFDPSTTTMEELVHFSRATDRREIARHDVTADAMLARKLACKPGSRWLLIVSMRWNPHDPGLPVCRTDNYVSEPYAKAVEGLASHHGLIADLILERTGVAIDEVDQVIRPIQLSSEAAEDLRADPGTSALEMTRRYLSRGSQIYVSISAHPADRFEYRMTLRRHRRQAVPLDRS